MANYRKTFFEENPSNNGWYTCEHCGRKFRKAGLQVDHIVPKSYGGWNSADNLQGLCPDCNKRKSNSLRDTIPDYLNNNVKRARRKFFDD